MTRIAFITHYTSLYGANRSLLNLIDGLVDRGDYFPYVIATSGGPVIQELERRHIPTAIYPFAWWMSDNSSSRASLRRLRSNLKLLPMLVAQMRMWDIDIVYTNSSVTPVGAMVSMLLRRPHVWHLRELGDLHYGFQFDWGKRLSRFLIGKADARIAISETVKKHLVNTSNSNGTFVIYNGVATKQQFDELRATVSVSHNKLSTAPYTFALVGLIHPSKRQDVAIQALKLVVEKCPNVRLLIVGSGSSSYVDRCHELVKRLHLTEKVEFWGYIEDPYLAFVEADAVLVCSKNEAMGRVTAEAMAACRPVIGFDSAGTAELIEHEYNGLLYQGGPAMLAGAMLRYLKEPAWAHDLGANGWTVAREKYSIENYTLQVCNVLQAVLNR